ncbi:Zn-ribbon domain-containing OB-fold protein [Mycolicibacterium elephantis]|uniref:Zn-ribbon domain-containing OB-fold protein n=1 Tax=Mycolicibacterium elephantis TaxID=81858 RepID=UPI000FE23A61|nr:OB-fold nucleic acid binding domain-containing protein [Mycolicibacterium elephantis]MCV7220433.1 OB-fold domain-containing protein [Mycolicibacterium elephantis]
MTTSHSSPVQIDPHEPPLSAPLKLSFDYTRSVGPLLSQFFTALRERRIVGVRGSDGRVHVPPAEFDPVTYERLTEIVPVGAVGTVQSWTWQPAPLQGQPLDRPFAWALIKLDGADTALLHAVDVGAGGSAESISTGARVYAHWVDEPVGAITDIACFKLGDQPEPEGQPDDREPVTVQVSPSTIEIQHTASLPESVFLRALEEGKLLGAGTKRGRDGKPGKVYFPPKEADPATGLALDEFVELPDKGTVTTFAVINIPFAGQRIKPPYVAAYVLLDGADIPFLHLVTEIDAAEVRMGMRVQAVWKPREEWGLGIDNIDYFRPTGEPDADYDSYKHHL